jgi:hypothetical protein
LDKAADALGNDNKRVVEITKDISALANSAGGIVIYGMRQFNDQAREHLPERIDPIDRRDFPKEWLEHVINTIQLRPKVILHPVQLSGMAFDEMQKLFCEPPTKKGIERGHLMEQHNNPENNLV